MLSDSASPAIYLAGPSVFRADSIAHGAHLKGLCARHGALGLYPLDNEISGVPDLAAAIRGANMALIRRCDAIVVDMTPFRGPGMDGGSAYEMGAGAALGKLVVGYTSEYRSYADRVAVFSACRRTGDVLRDADGLQVEDFGEWSPDNLMMAKGISALFMTPEDAIAHAVMTLAAGWTPAEDCAPDQAMGPAPPR